MTNCCSPASLRAHRSRRSTDPLVLCRLAAERELGRHSRSALDRAGHRQRCAEGLDAVSEPAQAGATRHVGAAGAVVGNRDEQVLTPLRHVDRDRRGVSVLDDVRESLRAHVVRSDRHLVGRDDVHIDGQLDLHRAPTRERLERARQPGTELARMQAPSDLLEVGGGVLEMLLGSANVVIGCRHRRQVPCEGHETPFDTVMEAQLQLPTLFVGSYHEPAS